MKGRISLFFITQLSGIFFLFLLSACAVRSVYVPTVGNTVLFNDKKQIQANGYIGTNHVELQATCNPVNHFLLGSNGSFGKGLGIYEGFAGMYGYSKENMKWRYEILGGASHTDNYLKQNSVWFNIFKEDKSNFETLSRYNKYYLQSSFGYYGKMEIYKINYSFSVSCRVSYLDFKKYIYRELNADSTALMNTPVYVVNKEYFNKNLFLLEPCITNKVGLRNFSLILQGQFMIPTSSQIDIRYTKFSPGFIFSVGLQYNFIFKKNRKTKP